ncbi:MAG TPA: DJ-1 family glyoxalase III, partial [Spirochaetota bacterium]|nr:DJ-1 family glyoxalase III [Spirochaetota bacterium]
METALILLADGLEETEATAVIDLLRRADIDTVTCSITQSLTVTGSHNIKIQADKTIAYIEEDKEYDIIILPGGQPGTTNLADSQEVAVLLHNQYKNNKYIGAICAAPTVLSKLGFLTDKTVTCYPACRQDIKAKAITDSDVEISEKIITSRGVGTALDF